MKKILFSLLLAAVAIMPLQVEAKTVTMRVGWSTPPEHLYGVFAKRFQELVAEYTNGSVEVKLFPSGQLGSEDAAFKSLQIGTVDGYFVTASLLSVHYPAMDVFSLPYIFENMNHMQKVLTSEPIQEFFDKFQEKTKVKFLTYGVLDTRDLYNTKKDINSFEDFAGLKYRVPKSPVMIETFKAFGAEPISLAWSETPSALQTGTVEGGDNGTTVIVQMKFYELAKHLTVLDHFAVFSPLLVSDRFIKKLSPEQLEQVTRAAVDTNKELDEIAINQLEETRAFLASQGMTVTRPDRAPFIAAAKTVQEKFAAEKDDEFRNLLQTIRSIQP